MQERTEEEILSRAPIKLTFGGRQYEVAVLPIRKAKLWREKLVESVKGIAELLNAKTNGHDDNFFAGLGAALVNYPEELAKLIFLYGPDLPKEEIMEATTEDQLNLAFSKIMAVAFPYQRQLSEMKFLAEILGQPLPSATPTN
jgi:hypothetical protein